MPEQEPARPVATLLVSPDPACEVRVREILASAEGRFSVRRVEDVGRAIAHLRSEPCEALLLHLAAVPPGHPLDPPAALREIRRAGFAVPVILLAEHDDPTEALAALREGAQDYLDLGSEGDRRLERSLQHAIERQHLIVELECAHLRARHAATHDPLTRLPNRSLLEQQMQLILRQAQHADASVALLYLDLDRFQTINDTLGHGAGDRVLAQVAERLAGCTRPGDIVARAGGDEFLILLTDPKGASAPGEVARRIHAKLADPFPLGGREYWVGASIGISVFPRDGCDAEALVRHADLAHLEAKAAGLSQTLFYCTELNLAAERRHLREHGLRRAVERGGLRLVYQPIFDAASLEIVGAEALLRWHDPQLGTVSPAEFIPVAEEIGLIETLGEAVLRSACEQLAQWKRDGHRLRMMVNLSAHQIDEERLRRSVIQALWDSDLQPADLEFEVTESALMRDEREAVRTFRALKRMGVGISLDDFGTGFSSLNYLKRFPVDTVKIDRSFVRDLSFDPDDAAIVSAILSIARQLDLRVVAEGVETEEQRVFLSERRCEMLQGFLFSQPLAAEDFAALLRNGLPRKREPGEPGVG